jgi:acid stress-induced BolA-like protein IbaG/YrbA
MIPIDEVRGLLEQAFPGARIDLSSPMGDNHHFQLLIVSDRFAGKSMVEQHQLVYRALGEAMHEAIHALSMRTYSPEQWKRAQGRG